MNFKPGYGLKEHEAGKGDEVTVTNGFRQSLIPPDETSEVFGLVEAPLDDLLCGQDNEATLGFWEPIR